MAKIILRNQSTNSAIEDIARSELLLETNAAYVIDMEQFRTWDNMAVNLPLTPATDDLGLVTGTLGTDFPCPQTGDLKTAGATTRYLGFTCDIPPEYVAGQSLTLRISGGMLTTISDTTATVDVECYPNDGDATAAGDICATALKTINSLTFANKDFVLTATARNPGDQLNFRIAIAVNDAATGTAVIGCLGKVALLCSIKG